LYLFQQAASLSRTLRAARQNQLSIGFVPTMGALHEGHLDLIRQAKKEYDRVICSIFVNPAQFNDPADLAKYPRTLEKDLEALALTGADYVYFPEVSDVYPPNSQPETYQFGALETVLEGAHRPGHFEGVGMVVARLLRITVPNGLLLGEKDYQQCMVLQSLLKQMQWEQKVALHICPTRRESNGLAMSSRNQRLTEAGKKQAALLYEIIKSCQERYLQFSPDQLSDWATHSLEAQGNIRVEYFSFADAQHLQPVQHWNESPAVRVLAAVWVEDVRLIDNALLF
jgi:pantoate--beta-alanine ligase